jgi:hypothetical protein
MLVEKYTLKSAGVKHVLDMRYSYVYNAHLIRFRHPTVSLNLRHGLDVR